MWKKVILTLLPAPLVAQLSDSLSQDTPKQQRGRNARLRFKRFALGHCVNPRSVCGATITTQGSLGEWSRLHKFPVERHSELVRTELCCVSFAISAGASGRAASSSASCIALPMMAHSPLNRIVLLDFSCSATRQALQVAFMFT